MAWKFHSTCKKEFCLKSSHIFLFKGRSIWN